MSYGLRKEVGIRLFSSNHFMEKVRRLSVTYVSAGRSCCLRKNFLCWCGVPGKVYSCFAALTAFS